MLEPTLLRFGSAFHPYLSKQQPAQQPLWHPLVGRGLRRIYSLPRKFCLQRDIHTFALQISILRT